MAYPIFDIDITKPLPSISVSDEDTGVAVLLRQKDKPIDFLLEALSNKRELKLQQLTERIIEIAGDHLSRERQAEDRLAPRKPTQFPSLTIAIPTKDRPQYIGRCLESIRKTRQDSRFTPSSIEILVVDNAPSDNRTREVVVSFSEVRYLYEPFPGANFARNRALGEARGQLVAFIDDDVVVDRHWLTGLLNAWSENPDAGAYTGLVLPYELVSQAQVLFEQRGGFRRGFKKVCYGQTLPGRSLYPALPYIFGTGANMAFQREVLQNLGGFDEAMDNSVYISQGGDLDIFYRVIRAGYSIQYDPSYLVFHQHRRELQALRKQYWTWGMGFLEFVEKAYRNDPYSRSKLRRAVVWWFAKELWQLQKSFLGLQAVPPSMIFAELWGGIQGLFGRYSRSKRKVETIRTQLIA